MDNVRRELTRPNDHHIVIRPSSEDSLHDAAWLDVIVRLRVVEVNSTDAVLFVVNIWMQFDDGREATFDVVK